LGGNGEYARGFVEAWNRRNLKSYLDEAGPEFEWVVAREHPAAKTHRGSEAVAAYLGDWVSMMPDLRVEIEELVEEGDKVLMVLRMTGSGAGSGAATDVRVATVGTFRNGRPVRTEEFLDPDEARRALAGG
jgi:ketosteroid isomerase-like protein